MKLIVGSPHVRLRSALLWASVTLGTGALARLTLPDAVALVTSPGPGFTALLVQCCAVAALGAALALWLSTTQVAWHSVTGHAPRRWGPVRSLLLTLCGVAALSGTTTATAVAPSGPQPPVGAEQLAGLPLPDRATGAAAKAAEPRRTVPVRPGDSLWTIAARELGPQASAADVASYWRRIQAANTAALGADPDLIHPGQQLRLPPRP